MENFRKGEPYFKYRKTEEDKTMHVIGDKKNGSSFMQTFSTIVYNYLQQAKYILANMYDLTKAKKKEAGLLTLPYTPHTQFKSQQVLFLQLLDFDLAFPDNCHGGLG